MQESYVRHGTWHFRLCCLALVGGSWMVTVASSLYLLFHSQRSHRIDYLLLLVLVIGTLCCIDEGVDYVWLFICTCQLNTHQEVRLHN